jgi:hypothetical protein
VIRRTWVTIPCAFLVLQFASIAQGACDESASNCSKGVETRVALISGGKPAAILAADSDFPGVLRAARNLQSDLTSVSGSSVVLSTAPLAPGSGTSIIVGTLGRNEVIDRLVREGKLDVGGVAGNWEAFVRQVVRKPWPGVESALVIAGADKRGTIFGIYDLSQRIGVSPWAWWADVPIARQANLSISAERFMDLPRVRYRGIFLNDEDPALLGWANMTFGGFNHRFYERVFELILRLKGNYLWPAMWGKALYDDDPESPVLADEMGVVIGTSHHEPLMRAHVEWERYGKGAWDYATNAERLRRFWREGIERMGRNESIVTIGMRGDGDKPMTKGTAVQLLERIVGDQRQIIADVTGRPASQTPQLWALYKEVQSYYDQGMSVPDDVTLLFCDDNWGNLRRLPAPGRKRAGGYGVYYHFDYVGGPRNYKWLNTNQIERTWEQMRLARYSGVDRIWIVNVGDLKPMEFPTEFFLDYAWNPEAFPVERVRDYPREWASRQFGDAQAAKIGELLTRYTQYNARRKPELLAPETYSLVDFREAERVVADYNGLVAEAIRVRDSLPAQYRDAYFQLVQFPIEASANLNELYVTVARNRLYAQQGRASANTIADRVVTLFARDEELTRQYHEDVAHGKWNHMMSQTHIGYTGWQQPVRNEMPTTRRIRLNRQAGLGVAIEGDMRAWPNGGAEPQLSALTPFSAPSRYIDVFNRGVEPFAFTAKSSSPWVRVSQSSAQVSQDARLEVSVDWASAPVGDHRVPIVVEGAGRAVTVIAQVSNSPPVAGMHGYMEANGYVAIEAAHYARAVSSQGVQWEEVPALGRTLSSMTTVPSVMPNLQTDVDSPRLEYDVNLLEAGEIKLQVTLSPTLSFTGGDGLRYAVSVDDEQPQGVNIHAGDVEAQWPSWVANNANVQTTQHRIDRPGAHTVKIWAVDSGVVFQRIVVVTKALPVSYLGPPESARRN